jgi:hypothetical protein
LRCFKAEGNAETDALRLVCPEFPAGIQNNVPVETPGLVALMIGLHAGELRQVLRRHRRRVGANESDTCEAVCSNVGI